MNRGAGLVAYGLVALAIAAVVCSGAAAQGPKPAEPGDVQMELRLTGAFGEDGKPTHVLTLDLGTSGGQWETPAGLEPAFNRATHFGRVVEGKITPTTVDLSLDVSIQGDQWRRNSAARAVYQVSLKRAADGKLDGTYSGTHRGKPLSGKAEGLIKPRVKIAGAGFVPVVPGEHPRMLFRKSDLPALRAKAKTPFGQAALARLEGATGSGEYVLTGASAVGLGLKYQLLGDKTYAVRAMEAVKAHMADRTSGPGSGKQAWGPRLEHVAVAYDLCCDAWPEAFRNEVRWYLSENSESILGFRGEFATGEFSWDMLYHGALLLGGVAHSGLALWGEPGPLPPKPASPADRPLAPEIAPALDYKPGPGVPVSKLELDKMPLEWIYVGGYKLKANDDVFSAQGGIGKVRPEVGMRIAFGGKEDAFRALSHEKDKGMFDGKIDVTEAVSRQYYTTNFFYTIIENDRPRLLQLQADHNGVDVYIGGVHRRNYEFVRLQKGLYPVMVSVYIGSFRPWGKALIKPRFVEGTMEQAQARMPALMAAYEEQLKDWQVDCDFWKASGGLSPSYMRMFYRGRSDMIQVGRRSLIVGGLPPEGTAFHFPGVDIILSHYVAEYRNMFGEEMSEAVELRTSMLGKMLGQPYNPARLPAVDTIKPGLSNEAFARLFGLVPETAKPTALALWNKAAGVEDEASETKAISSDPVYGFINYPLDMKPAGR